MILRPFLLMAALSASPALAQPLPFNVTTLSVTAEGKVERVPDVANLSAGVVTTAPTANEAMRQNATRMAAVVAALRRAGIAERDTQTSSVNLQPQYLYRQNQPPQLTAYQASNMVSVRLRKIADSGRIIDTLVAEGANQINGPHFMVDKADAALDEARVSAVAKARARADLYARAAGLRVKRIVQISEGGIQQPPHPMPVARMASMDAQEKATSVSPGEVELTTSVNVTFELE